MVEELSREIRKLEVRLNGFLKAEENFVKELEKCLEKFWKLSRKLESLKKEDSPNLIDELLNLKMNATEALSEALRKGSDAEHEKAHLLESYGNLVLASEIAIKDTV